MTVAFGFFPYGSMGATTIVVRNGESIVDAVRQALPGDVVEIRSNDTFHERLTFQDVQPRITVRAGIGFTPTLEGDTTTEWATNIPPGQDNVFVFINTQMEFSGLHFRIDLTDLEGVLQSEGYQVLKVAGAGQFRFTNCTFEYTGLIDDTRVVGRNMIRLENASETVFDNCDFRYTTNVVRWPTFNNTVGYFQPSNATLTARFQRCRFDAVTDFIGRARNLGAGGGAGGATVLEVTDCQFGLHRFDSRQHQQAYISPAISNTQTTVRDCVFPAGANRYFGLEPGLTIEAESCLFMNPRIDSRGGEIYLPDPGGNTIVSTNCVFLFASRLGIPFRGANDGEGRQYEFYHCTFNDLSGDRASSFGFKPALLEVTPSSPIHTFRSCIFNVPGFSHHLLVNIQAPGPGVVVMASDNLIHSKVFPLTERVIPTAAFPVREDPLLNPDDGFHLLPGSPAIDRVPVSNTLEDFDGRARPIGDSTDIGAHEFNGTQITRPSRQIHIPADAATLAEATALATRNFDEIIIDSDGPFFETMRGERYQSHLTVRAGVDAEPMIVVDSATDFLDILDSGDGGELAAMSEVGTPFLLTRTGRFEGLHWRIDLTDMDAITPPEGLEDADVSTRLLMLQSNDAELTFERCTFELFGNARPGAESVHGLRPTVYAEGVPRCTFNDCDWVYEMDLIAWPGVTSAGLGYAIPKNEVLELTLNDCGFEAIPDTAGRARHIGLSAGSGGDVMLEINRCRFGENRGDYEEPASLGGNRQRQQAHVVIVGERTQASINDSVFLDGVGRQLGLGDNLDVFIRRCVLEPTTVGHALFPDPAGGRFHVANSVIRFDSHSYATSSADAAIRGGGLFGDRIYTFVHCLFQDVNGVNGNPDVGLMTVDNNTGVTGLTRFENCIFDMPAATRGVIDNTKTAGGDPVGTPTGSGNLLNTGTLMFRIFPQQAVVSKGEPRWDLDGSDRHHLSECSLLAVDEVPRPLLMELEFDIDGDRRPFFNGEPGDADAAHFDIGPDEFTGVPESEEFCDIPVDPIFRRGDHDVSGIVDLTDALNILSFLFLGKFPPKCADASDADNSGFIDLSDALNLLASLFLGTVTIPPPGVANCGIDPKIVIPAGGGLPAQAIIRLGCESYDKCETP